jgi:hypothetical protein
VSSVLNARAAGRVSVDRRGHRRDYAIREVAAAAAGPVLKRYVGVAIATATTHMLLRRRLVPDGGW